MKTLTSALLLAGVLASPVAAQSQGFDILIPTGSNDGAFALVDKDKDGKYTTPGESWDYLLYDTNTSTKYFILQNGRLIFNDSILDALVSVRDTNANGKIEVSERTTYFDYATALGASNPSMITVDAQGWIWASVHTGTAEGIYKHKDLDNNGSAEGLGETIAVLTETMPNVGIHNTPNSSGTPPVYPVLALTGVDYITYDATYGNGRFLIEEESSDQSIALEDKNADGDFDDPGECYLFCALLNGGNLSADVHPDVLSGALPSAGEIRGIVPDFLTNSYYLMSSDTNAGNTDAAIIFRGRDLNADGDINDSGEVTIFWDGSLDSVGATNEYNFIVGMEIDLAGRLYVNAEFDDVTDSERLLMIQDRNNDGDANDAGETEVLWELGTDRTHYRPVVLPIGTINALTGVTTMAEANYYGTASCGTSLPGTHNIQYGSSGNGGGSKPPVIGNANWTVRTWGVAPMAPGAYGIGLTKIPNGFPLDGGSTCFAYNSLDILTLNFTTTAAGDHELRIGVPNDPSLLGLWTYWQSLVVDATAPGGLGITLSDGMEIKFGDWSMTR